MVCKAQITRGCAQNHNKRKRANTSSRPTQRKKGQFYIITTKFYIQRSAKKEKKKKAFEIAQNEPNFADLSGYNHPRIG